MTEFVAPIDLPGPLPGAFGACECGCPIYTHGRVNMDGNQVWKGCRVNGCDCTSFKASDGSSWPNVYASAVPGDPTDLDVNSEAWVDGEVVLSHEREPDVGGRA